MRRYDPLKAPDPKEWLALGEQERIDLVQQYHRRAGIRLPNEKLHAGLHATIENQIALGDELPVERTLHRLMAEGLDRHDAVHAIGTALTDFIYDLSKGVVTDEDPNVGYMANVERLTVEGWRQLAKEPMEPDDSTTPAIDALRILDDLDIEQGLPEDAIRLASAHRTIMVPLFLQAIEQHLTGRVELLRPDALFFAFHLLGDWREKSAYRPLARVLRLPRTKIKDILEDATTETSHRVMAAVFDGDPTPLYDVILDPGADEFVRSRMCEVLVMTALRDELPRAEAARFLRTCYSDLEPKDEDNFVWNGWQSAIAALGLVELKPLVEQAFERQYVSPTFLNFQDFEEDLQRALENPASPWRDEDEYTLFGDTIEELSGWHAFSPEYLDSLKHKRPSRDASHQDQQWSPTVPAVNPFKGVGRNDPCPCGSGKKFKKCCLN